MKAAVVEQPGQLEVQDIPEPTLGDYDARCELLYGATCTGTDQHLIEGKFPWPVRYPTVLGHESIGRVVEVGKKVRSFKPGDMVTRVGTLAPPDTSLHVNWGGFAEYGIARDHWAMREDGLPPEQWNGHRINQILPPDLDPAAATMMITWRETLSYITRMGVGAGARILILGSGGNGNAFAAHAANRGAELVALTGNVERAAVGRGVGATHYYDYKSSDLAQHIAQDCPEQFDFIIDAVGKRGAINAVLPLLKSGGVIGVYGLDDWGDYTIDPNCSRGTFTYYNGGYDEAETHEQVVAYMRAGKLNASHWLDLEHPFSLENIHDAFAALRQRKMVKALIKLSD